MSEDGAVRVSDAERTQVADRLAAAHAEGRLTLAEYDERVRAAHGAVVRDDLAPLTADLPGRAEAPAPGVVGRSRSETPRRSHHRSHRGPGGLAGPFARLFAGPFPVPPGMPGRACEPRRAVAVWAGVSALNLLIWLAVVLGSGTAVYPWWIWVAGPWGVALLVGALGRSAASRAEGAAPSRT